MADFTANPMEVSTSDTEVIFTNNSVNATSYTWNFGDNTQDEHTTDVTHTFPDEEAGSYVVTLIASNGENCADTISAIIKVNEEVIYYIPNTFTPDEDQFNETFLPIFTSGFDPQDFEMLIFNRWGELIFESHNAEIGWNGKYGEKTVQDGTYIWKIEFKETNSDKRHTLHGHVTLIR